MAGFFSLMLTLLEVEGSELGHMLGHPPGVMPEDFAADIQAGLVETSQLLAIVPDLVDPEYKTLPRRDVERWLAEKGEAKRKTAQTGLAALPAALAGFKATLHYFAEETYSGQPDKASAELGVEECRSPVWKLRHLFVDKTAIRLSDWLLDNPRIASRSNSLHPADAVASCGRKGERSVPVSIPARFARSGGVT
jgi:hypothetical protein